MSLLSPLNNMIEKAIMGSPAAMAYLKYRNAKAWELKDAFEHPDTHDCSLKRLQALAHILQYARDHVPYYRKHIPAGDITPENAESILHQIPPLTKTIIRNEKEQIYSDELNNVCRYWSNTGGSTGEPLHFPVSRNTGFENELALYLLQGWKLHDRIISFDGAKIPDDEIARGLYYTKRIGALELPYGNIRFSTLFLEEQYLPDVFQQLDSLRPDFLRGYSSAFIILSHYILKNNLQLTKKLKGLYFTSELCPETELPFIREAFQCHVFGQYGNTEATQYGLAQDGKTYLCSPTFGYVEILDPDGTPVKEGECGEVVSTGFHNYAMPFIRYRTGDLAEYGGVKNGFVILRSLQGRTLDFIVNADNKRIYLVGFIFGRHMKAFNHLASWQLEQSKPGLIQMKIVRGEGYGDEDAKELADHFASVQVKVDISYVDHIERTMRGKQKFLIQHL